MGGELQLWNMCWTLICKGGEDIQLPFQCSPALFLHAVWPQRTRGRESCLKEAHMLCWCLFFSRVTERIINTCWTLVLHLCSAIGNPRNYHGEGSCAWNTCQCCGQTQVWAWVLRARWLYSGAWISLSASARIVEFVLVVFPSRSAARLLEYHQYSLHLTLHRSMYSRFSAPLCMLFTSSFIIFIHSRLRKSLPVFLQAKHLQVSPGTLCEGSCVCSNTGHKLRDCTPENWIKLLYYCVLLHRCGPLVSLVN